jgi:hypothetical protein
VLPLLLLSMLLLLGPPLSTLVASALLLPAVAVAAARMAAPVGSELLWGGNGVVIAWVEPPWLVLGLDLLLSCECADGLEAVDSDLKSSSLSSCSKLPGLRSAFFL